MQSSHSFVSPNSVSCCFCSTLRNHRNTARLLPYLIKRNKAGTVDRPADLRQSGELGPEGLRISVADRRSLNETYFKDNLFSCLRLKRGFFLPAPHCTKSVPDFKSVAAQFKGNHSSWI